MKKFITLLLAVVLTAPAFAQFNGARSRYNHNNIESYYGLRLGVNISSLSSDITKMDMDSRAGLAFGAVYGLQLANSAPVWLEAGLFYSEKGGKTEWDYKDSTTNKPSTGKVTCRMTYLELPIVVKYGFDIFDDVYLDPFVGGYLALGIAGRTKEYYDHESYSSFDNANRFDGGLRVGCGLEYQMLYAEIGFDFGITNIGKGDFDSIHNRNLFINVGVNF